MLYYLSLFEKSCGPLRLFDYVTFRAGGAAATAFLIVACFGGPFARMLRNMNLRAADRYDGLIPPELLASASLTPSVRRFRSAEAAALPS